MLPSSIRQTQHPRTPHLGLTGLIRSRNLLRHGSYADTAFMGHYPRYSSSDTDSERAHRRPRATRALNPEGPSRAKSLGRQAPHSREIYPSHITYQVVITCLSSVLLIFTRWRWTDHPSKATPQGVGCTSLYLDTDGSPPP